MEKSKRLEEIEKKIAELTARKINEENRLKTQERKNDTRRKILIGAFFLEQAEKNGTLSDLVKKIEPYLKRDGDKILFGIQIDKKPKEKKAANQNSISKEVGIE